MAHYWSATEPGGAGTTVRPIAAILSTATVAPVIREVKIVNLSTTACTYRLVTFTGGTAGGDLTEHKDRAAAPPALCLAKGLWTADVTSIDEEIDRFRLGAVDGVGEVAPYGGAGLEGVVGATKGIGLVPVGTGQLTMVRFVWEE